MLHRDLRLAAKTNCPPYHAAHLSCRQAVDLIARAKERGLAGQCGGDTPPSLDTYPPGY